MLSDWKQAAAQEQERLEAVGQVLYKADVAFGFLDMSEQDMYFIRAHKEYQELSIAVAQEEHKK